MPGAIRTTTVPATGGSGANPATPSAAPAVPRVGRAIGSAAGTRTMGADGKASGAVSGIGNQIIACGSAQYGALLRPTIAFLPLALGARVAEYMPCRAAGAAGALRFIASIVRLQTITAL